jgi:hypothetical protein
MPPAELAHAYADFKGRPLPARELSGRWTMVERVDSAGKYGGEEPQESLDFRPSAARADALEVAVATAYVDPSTRVPSPSSAGRARSPSRRSGNAVEFELSGPGPAGTTVDESWACKKFQRLFCRIRQVVRGAKPRETYSYRMFRKQDAAPPAAPR